MAKVKLYLDIRVANKEGKHHLTIRLSKKNITKFIRTGILLEPDHWNKGTSKIVKAPKFKNLNARAQSYLKKLQRYIDLHPLETKQMDIHTLKRTLEVELKKNATTTKSTITRAIHGESQNGTLGVWGKVLVDRALRSQRKSTADWYNTSIKAFITFNKGKDIQLIDIDESFLEEFKAYGYEQIICPRNGDVLKPVWKPNTIAGYMEAIRSIMNRAITERKEFIPASHQPFKSVALTREMIEVDSIEKKDIYSMRNLNLEEDSDIWKARARFLFMFNCQGLNFTDLAKLKIEDKIGSTISYYRAKTSRRKKRKKITVSLTKEALRIWDYFTRKKKKGDYAFDILETITPNYNPSLKKYNELKRSSNPAVTEKNRIKSRMKKQNQFLAEISDLINCRVKITTYDARYGWVNAALDAGIPEEKIGKGLGHSNLSVTRTYFEERHKRTDLGDLNEIITS